MPELLNLDLINDANLISYWRLEGNSNDYKNSNNGTDTSITYGASNGFFGQGASFNDSSSLISLPDNNNLQAASFSVVGWLNVTGNGVVISNFNIIASQNKGWIARILNSHLGLSIYNGLGGNGGLEGTTNVATSTWLHAAFIYNATGTNVTLYLNGAQEATGSAGNTLAVDPTTNVRIGCYSDGTNKDFYGGKIDDLAYFSRVLTAQEVQKIFYYQGAFLFNLI